MATKKATDDKATEKAAKVAEEEIKNSKTVDIEGEPTEARKSDDEEEHFAKSGKKSKKHIEEVKAEEERQAKKA